MNLKETLAAGQDGFLLTVFSISATLILGYFLGRLLKMNKKSSRSNENSNFVAGSTRLKTSTQQRRPLRIKKGEMKFAGLFFCIFDFEVMGLEPMVYEALAKY